MVFNWERDNDGQDTDKTARVLLLGGRTYHGSKASSSNFSSN